MEAETLGQLAQRVLETVEGVVLGQRRAAATLLAGYLADGHVLLEGVPGIGKTLLAQAMAGALGLDLKRVQLTPDFMPADLIGTNVFRSG
ncbi:MAG TPA: AAA family ATPase, partial [Acidobacteria bacterium]|nr:AAA family ATPase [Acidobacteriota bacterium]